MNATPVRVDSVRELGAWRVRQLLGISDIQAILRQDARVAETHNVEIEHALRLANVGRERTQQILASGFEENARTLGLVQSSVEELKRDVVDAVSSLSGDLWQLHCDNTATHAILNDVLWCLSDRDGYLREVDCRRQREVEQARLLAAKGEYSDALALARRALAEKDTGKVGPMLDEAMVLLERASQVEPLALQANFQLAFLHQAHKRNLKAAAVYYERSLGASFSAHNVRTLRHLAHIDYLELRYDDALQRMMGPIQHSRELEAFCSDLGAVTQATWPSCIDLLAQALQTNASLLRRCSRLESIRELLARERRFSATESFIQSYSTVVADLKSARPDPDVYYYAARYAAKSARDGQAREFLETHHARLLSPAARRSMLIEALACPDFENAAEAQDFLRKAWRDAEAEWQLQRGEAEKSAEAARTAELGRQWQAYRSGRQREREERIKQSFGWFRTAFWISVAAYFPYGFVSCCARTGPDSMEAWNDALVIPFAVLGFTVLLGILNVLLRTSRHSRPAARR